MSGKLAKGGSIEIWAPEWFIINAFLYSKIAAEKDSPFGLA